MSLLEKKRGSFKFDFSGGGDLPFENRMSRAEWCSELDKSDTLMVSLALSRKEAADFKLAQLPTRLSVKWQDRPLFKGGLLAAEQTGGSRFDLIYKDNLYALERRIEGGYLKNESLSNAVRGIVSQGKLEAKFFGDFSDLLPSIFLGDRTLYENLVFLADKFGFFFYFHGPSELVHFIRLGSSSASVQVDAGKSVYGIHASKRSDLSWGEVNCRVFDHRTLSTQNKKIASQSIYGSLSQVSGHSSYRTKQSWPFSQGEYEVNAHHATEFDDSQRRVNAPLAKKAICGETTQLTSYEPLALPGELLELSQTWNSDFHEGSYLVQKCLVTFQSSLPRAETFIVRP